MQGSPRPVRILVVNLYPPNSRGDEAVLRTTLEYLSRRLGDSCVLEAPIAVDVALARRRMADLERVRFVQVVKGLNPVYKRCWKLAERFGYPAAASRFKMKQVESLVERADLVVLPGTDVFSMCYGGPYPYVEIVRMALRRRKKVAIFAASIGPFPDEEVRRYVLETLEAVDFLGVRESESKRYLESVGLQREVVVGADPAFLLEARECPGVPEVDGAPIVGVGMSWLYPKYLGGDVELYLDVCTDLVDRLVAEGAFVFLVPHHFKDYDHKDDYRFCEMVLSRVRRPERCWMPADRTVDCRGMKGLIGRVDAFIGARTHTTIAAISQGIPTAVLSYSLKSVGIFGDLYGHQDFVVTPEDVRGRRVFEKFRPVLERRAELAPIVARGAERFRRLAEQNLERVVELAEGLRF